MKKLTKEVILEILQNNREEIKKFGVEEIILFGSYARDEQKETSDIDFLVKYKSGRGLFKDSVGLLHLLRDNLFNKKIDLVKSDLIREELKPDILGGVQYVTKI